MSATNTNSRSDIKERTRIDASKSQLDFKTALTDFETSLLTPIVSGELPAWMDTVEKTWAEASGQLHYQIKHSHPRQYDEISKQDPELLPRLELLKAEDEAIEQNREQLGSEIKRISQQAPKLEPDEEKAQKFVKTMIDDGTTLLSRVRKQEVALQTWYVEAFNRDRGAVD
jgi:hypothetical protein